MLRGKSRHFRNFFFRNNIIFHNLHLFLPATYTLKVLTDVPRLLIFDIFCNKLLFWKTCLLKLFYVYDFFILNSRQKVLLRQFPQFKVFLGNKQTTKAKILCSFCSHSKLFIVQFIACNVFWKMNPRSI